MTGCGNNCGVYSCFPYLPMTDGDCANGTIASATVNGMAVDPSKVAFRKPPNPTAGDQMTVSVADLDVNFNMTIDGYFVTNTQLELCMAFSGTCPSIEAVVPTGKTCGPDVAMWTRVGLGRNHGERVRCTPAPRHSPLPCMQVRAQHAAVRARSLRPVPGVTAHWHGYTHRSANCPLPEPNTFGLLRAFPPGLRRLLPYLHYSMQQAAYTSIPASYTPGRPAPPAASPTPTASSSSPTPSLPPSFL